MEICAVIPAAGKGSRLGAPIPKILVEIMPGVTIWDIIEKKLSKFVDSIHVIMSAKGANFLENHIKIKKPKLPVSIGLQAQPIGMGDAIFSNKQYWDSFNNIIIMWGDQACVSENTIGRSIHEHTKLKSVKKCTIPVVKTIFPYVDYFFSNKSKLTSIAQSREGDKCREIGLSDVGTFILSTSGLHETWDEYLKIAQLGNQTSEVNFLPFLPWISTQEWIVQKVDCLDPDEARGVNNKEDLVFIRNKFIKDQKACNVT